MQRYIEARPNGQITGRVLYYVKGILPTLADGCSWLQDESFKIEEDATHDPEKLRYYKTALIDGCAIADL